MTSKSKDLIRAFKDGRLIDVAYKLSRGNDQSDQAVSILLSELHNKGDIDLVKSYLSLRNHDKSGPNFFLARRLFEKALPTLSAPVLQVMTCVRHLINEAGQDMFANIGTFSDFLAADPSRPTQAYKIILESPDKWFSFVCSTILAGTRLELNTFFDFLIKLTRHETANVRINAIYTLGIVDYSPDSSLRDRAIEEVINISVDEHDDKQLAVVINSASSLARVDDSLIEKACIATSNALKKGMDQTLHAATEEFGLHTKDLPDLLLNLFISNLPRVKPENSGSINYIDLGISNLFKRSDKTLAIDCLEAILLVNKGSLNIKSFDSVKYEILAGGTLTLNKLLTRWFISADRVLCNGILEIIESVHGDPLHLEIEIKELSDEDPNIFLFLARKTAGYLFTKPVSMVSIIISILRSTSEEKVMEDLGEFLLSPILLNYPGSAREFLESQIPKETEQVAAIIKSSLKGLDDYHEKLRGIETIPELHPSLGDRESYTRNLNRQMSEAYKKAMKGSFVELISTKSVILYGRSSINYIRQDSSSASRMEIPMHLHSVEMDIPMRQNLDPFGMDYMLRLFRAERMIKA